MNEKLIKVFEYALNQENTGLDFFRSSLQRMGIGAAVSAFKRLIQEEERHIAFITGIINDLKQGSDISPGTIGTVPENVDFFTERERSEFLTQCVEGSMIPDVTVFNTAWLIEKDLSEFYQKLADSSDGKVKEAFTMLAKWEKEHEKFFRDYRDKLSAVYANMPWGG